MLQYVMYGKISALYKVKRDFSLRRSLSLYKIPIFLDIIVFMFFMCSFQVRLESIVTPKNLVDFFSTRDNPSMYKLHSVSGEWTFLKYIKLVLSMFKESLLLLNQEEIFCNSALRVQISVCGSVCE